MSKTRAWMLRLFALAWLAVFMMAVAPTVAGLVGPVTRDALIQICTPLGIQFVPADLAGGDSEDTPAPGSAASHCPLCATPGSHALPSETNTTPDTAPHGAVHERPLLDSDRPGGRLPHTAHKPRAPPDPS